MRPFNTYLKIACSAVILLCISVLALSQEGEAANPGHEGFCCPQTGALCIVNCHLRDNAYAVTEMRNCPSYPFVYVEGGPCPGVNSW